LLRASVELAKDWRTDRYLRRLEAMMIVADKKSRWCSPAPATVLEPEMGVAGIGSGGNYALPRPARCSTARSMRGDRVQVARYRRRHLRLHQPQRHHRILEIVTE